MTPKTVVKELGQRHIQVLKLASEGANTWEISDDLDYARETVVKHLMEARRVLKARNTVHAVAIAIRTGIIK